MQEIIKDSLKYHLFVGRFQPPHKGHMYLFDKILNEGGNVCIAIRDVEPDYKNPLFADQVKNLWEKIYTDRDRVKVIIIPDIVSIKYGRSVGYSVEEIKVPDDIASISATDIRKKILENKTDWKNYVHPNIWEDIKNLLS